MGFSVANPVIELSDYDGSVLDIFIIKRIEFVTNSDQRDLVAKR